MCFCTIAMKLSVDAAFNLLHRNINRKGLEEDEKMSRNYMYFASFYIIYFAAIMVDLSSNFKDI